MKALATEGIVLSRTNFGEADRILTILTPDQGKLRLIAKGVRKIKSKLAGGIELFSVTELSYISGKNEIGTLVSSRLKVHYGHIVEDIDRVQLAYELLKVVNRITEDHPEAEYFELLEQAFIALNDSKVGLKLIAVWFYAQLLKINGHGPNLTVDVDNNKLDPEKTYRLDTDSMRLEQNSMGRLGAGHIKALRLVFSSYPTSDLQRIEGLGLTIPEVIKVVDVILSLNLPQARNIARYLS